MPSLFKRTSHKVKSLFRKIPSTQPPSPREASEVAYTQEVTPGTPAQSVSSPSTDIDADAITHSLVEPLVSSKDHPQTDPDRPLAHHQCVECLSSHSALPPVDTRTTSTILEGCAHSPPSELQEAIDAPPTPQVAYAHPSPCSRDSVGQSTADEAPSSFPSQVSSCSLPPNWTASSRPTQHFFAGASNFAVGQFNSYAVRLTEDEKVQGLIQLLQSNLAQRTLSQGVGYSQDNGIIIVDALGDRLVLPPSILGKFSDVHDLMLKHFRGKPGAKHVDQRRYCIVTEHDGTLVRARDWKGVLKSGEAVIMAMRVEKVWIESVRDTCPQCGQTRLGTYQVGGWLVCRKCDKSFACSMEKPRSAQHPPPNDKELGFFRHLRKSFVDRPVLSPPSSPSEFTQHVQLFYEWFDATYQEESRFEAVP